MRSYWGSRAGADGFDIPAKSSSRYSLWPDTKSFNYTASSVMHGNCIGKENTPMKTSDPVLGTTCSKITKTSLTPTLNVQRLRPRASIDSVAMRSETRMWDSGPKTGNVQTTDTGQSRRKSVHKRVMSKVKEGVLSRSRSTHKFVAPSQAEPVLQFEIAKLVPNTNLVTQTARPAVAETAVPSNGNLSMSMLKLDDTDRSKAASPLPTTLCGSSIGNQPVTNQRLSKVPQYGAKPRLDRFPTQNNQAGKPIYIELCIRPTSRYVGPDDPFPTWVTVTAKVCGEAGSVSDLQLSVDPGMNGRVHNVLGPLRVSSLYQGEVAEIRVKVSSIANYDENQSSYINNDSVDPTFNDLCSELEFMLGDGLLELLTVKARYKHSLLPESTSLSTEQSFKIHQQEEHLSAKQVLTGRTLDKGKDTHSDIAPIANASPPRATTALQSPSKSPTRGCMPTQPGLPYIKPTPSPDAARQVWSHIRRDSKSAADLFDMVQSGTIDDSPIVAMQQQALQNKRSVGAETLRDWRSLSNVRRDSAWSEDGVLLIGANVPWLL